RMSCARWALAQKSTTALLLACVLNAPCNSVMACPICATWSKAMSVSPCHSASRLKTSEEGIQLCLFHKTGCKASSVSTTLAGPSPANNLMPDSSASASKPKVMNHCRRLPVQSLLAAQKKLKNSLISKSRFATAKLTLATRMAQASCRELFVVPETSKKAPSYQSHSQVQCFPVASKLQPARLMTTSPMA